MGGAIMDFHPALGQLRGIPDDDRALFASDDFDPLPTAGAGKAHVEPDQPFSAYRAAQPRRPYPGRRKLVLVPIRSAGDEAVDLQLDPAVTVTAAWFGLPVVVGRTVDADRCLPRPPAGAARSLSARHVLTYLAERQPDDTFATVAVTDRSLDAGIPGTVGPGEGEPEGKGVHGQAWPLRGVAVVSGAARPPGQGRRAHVTRLVVHELGHLFGMLHCGWFRCVMNSNPAAHEPGAGAAMGSVDERPLRLCPICLRKLSWCTGMDLRGHYRALGELLDRHGLHREAAWHRARANPLVAS